MSTVLLAGGAGFVGSNLAREFAGRGDSVIVLDRPDARWENVASLGDRCRAVRGDLGDPSSAEGFFSGTRVGIDDLARAVVDLSRQGAWNEVYNVGSGAGTSLREIPDLVQQVSGCPLRGNYAAARSVDLPASILDVSKLRRTIPWDSLVPLRAGEPRR